MRVQTLLSTALVAAAFAAPAWAHPITYVGTLSNLGEPAPANLSLGTGTTFVVLDTDAFTMRVHADFSGLTGNTTASHIHCCVAVAGTGSAGVASVTPSFTGFPLGVTSGTYDRTYDMALASSYNPAFITANGGSVGTAFSALATGISTGRAYLNIHSTFVGGGEIRAFLVPVPEPETYAMMVGGLVLMGTMLRRRRQR